MSGGDLLVHGGRLIGPSGVTPADVLIRGGRVAEVGAGLEAPGSVARLDAAGKLVLPGLTDPQVHFREPSLD